MNTLFSAPALVLYWLPAFFCVNMWFVTTIAEFTTGGDAPSFSDFFGTVITGLVPVINVVLAWILLTEIIRELRRA